MVFWIWWCHAQCQRGSRCRIAQLDTLEKLVDDDEEAQCTSLVLRLPWSYWRDAKISQTQEMWSNNQFPDWGTYSVSPPTYIHVLEIKYDIHRRNCSVLLVVCPWYQPTTVCLPVVPIWCGWTCIGSDADVQGWWVTGVTDEAQIFNLLSFRFALFRLHSSQMFWIICKTLSGSWSLSWLVMGLCHMSHPSQILDPFWEVQWKLLTWLPQNCI